MPLRLPVAVRLPVGALVEVGRCREALNASRQTFCHWRKAGFPISVAVGRQWYLPTEPLTAWLVRNGVQVERSDR
jgi:hypothetical protein